ncbi:hypothetical protein AALP_AA4G149500 [Arabis alpina]|uniref:Uncharacterized protein n=1 Tax=Arabis alpina TaxID=50452 RepID=A0A087H3C9_ARAAL|nr:hypothetical protein AALP_AA4G149500 [Arabis alpina]
MIFLSSRKQICAPFLLLRFGFVDFFEICGLWSSSAVSLYGFLSSHVSACSKTVDRFGIKIPVVSLALLELCRCLKILQHNGLCSCGLFLNLSDMSLALAPVWF